MPNDQIYIVTGEYGEYSDWQVWVVCATLTEAEAQQIVDACNKWADENPNSREKNPHDQGMTGQFKASYGAEAVGIRKP